MCNLHSMTKSKDAMRQFPLAFEDRGINMPSLPGIYPNHSAPVVRNNPGVRELAMVRGGLWLAERRMTSVPVTEPGPR